MFAFDPQAFPLTPGVYLMKDDSGRIIYAGKALCLRKRLSSYFAASARHPAKTRVLVSRIASIDVLLTATEKEALLLEASLIKKHRPRYNVVLKDDKSHVLFRLDRSHPFPRLTMTRTVKPDGAAYYGPFTSAQAARDTQKALIRAFGLRRCSDRAMTNRARPCLYHHLGQCPAPCVLPVDPEAYREAVRKVEMVLSGRAGDLLAALGREMEALAADLEFEKAARVRDTMAAIRRTVERQVVALPEARDLDLAAVAGGPQALGLGVVYVRGGRLMDQKGLRLPGLTLEDGPEALHSFLSQSMEAGTLIPPQIVLPYELEGAEALAEVLADRRGGPVRLSTPRSDAEKRLLDLARKVAARAAERQEEDLAVLVGRRLGLAGPARRVECVDVSHLAGADTRAGLVVFEDGRPVPGDFRLFAFPDLEGSGDDFAVLARFAERRAAQGPPWPDLLLVDGGRGQLAAVAQGLGQEERGGPAPEAASGPLPPGTGPELAAIAKGPSRRAGELEDRIFRPGRKNPLDLKPGSPELLFLQHVRDAAHRFVLGRQRQARTRTLLRSELLNLPGVGPATAKILWDRFASVEAMSRAEPADLAALPGVGRTRAERLAQALRSLAGKA